MPEIARRIGLIAMNTALEVDICGNVNSTHTFGTTMVNGIGGSGDFSRNSGLVVFLTPSAAKKGAISRVVPHVTHTEHCGTPSGSPGRMWAATPHASRRALQLARAIQRDGHDEAPGAA